MTTLAERDPERLAAIAEDGTVTRCDLEARANRLARAYAERGVAGGDTVTLALPNGIEFLASCLAVWKLGAVPNPISERLPDAERRSLIERARPRLIVGVTAQGEVASVPAGFEPPASVSAEALPDATPPHERAMASSGSTGRPKLIVAASPGVYDAARASPLFRARRAVLVPGPLYHAAPWSACWQALFAGCQVVLMRRFDARRWLELVEEHRIDRSTVVPTMMLRIWRDPERERFDVSSLEFVMTGGAPCPEWLMRAWIEWLGADVMHEAFGPSERIGGTFITGREWLLHPGSVGRPAAGSRLRILGPEGGELPPGEVGEIHLMPAGGPGSTYRYVGADPDRKPDGWESVGDMGWLDADGYLYLADRKSDMILTGGRNVYPAEVEAAIEEHPAVRSCAVIGLPDEELGQVLHAIVETAGEAEPDAGVPTDELRAHVAERLVSYKVPRSFELVDEPLRDDAGKLRRSALREARLGEP